MDTFREESKFSTWLYRVAANASFIQVRSENKHKNNVSLEDYSSYNESGVLEGVQIKDWSDRPDEAFLSREMMGIIEKAVSELPRALQNGFPSQGHRGVHKQRSCKNTGLSVTAVKSRIHRVRLFLRDKLSDYFYEWRK